MQQYENTELIITVVSVVIVNSATSCRTPSGVTVRKKIDVSSRCVKLPRYLYPAWKKQSRSRGLSKFS